MAEFHKGNNLVNEKTGSAVKINLDSQWEYDFDDDNTPPGRTPTAVKKVENKQKK